MSYLIYNTIGRCLAKRAAKIARRMGVESPRGNPFEQAAVILSGGGNDMRHKAAIAVDEGVWEKMGAMNIFLEDKAIPESLSKCGACDIAGVYSDVLYGLRFSVSPRNGTLLPSGDRMRAFFCIFTDQPGSNDPCVAICTSSTKKFLGTSAALPIGLVMDGVNPRDLGVPYEDTKTMKFCDGVFYLRVAVGLGLLYKCGKLKAGVPSTISLKCAPRGEHFTASLHMGGDGPCTHWRNPHFRRYPLRPDGTRRDGIVFVSGCVVGADMDNKTLEQTRSA